MAAIRCAILVLAIASASSAQTPAADPNQALIEAFAQGRAALESRQYEQAVAALEKAAELGPGQMAIWANLGAAYNGLAATKSGADAETFQQKSIDAWANAIALKPGDAGSHNNYALSLAKSGKFMEAETELIQAAQLDPANARQYYFNFAAILVNSGRSDAAANAFRMAIDAAPDDPRNAESYYQYALCLTHQATLASDGKIVAAPGTQESFRKYRQIAPDGPNVGTAARLLARLDDTIEPTYRSPAIPAVRPRRIPVDGRVQQSRLKTQVRPVYPPEARTAGITGAVEMRAVIGPDGAVWELTVPPGKGHPFLIPAALESVKKWVYQPSMADDQPVEVETTIQVNFQLSR